MGNSLAGAGSAGKKKAKLMKIDGEIIKIKTPTKVFQVMKDYPGHVLLESKSVKKYGIRANPLDQDENLVAGKVYFLVELPKLPETTAVSRRVKSGVNVTVKDRLELLLMSRRSVSEVTVARTEDGDGSVRVKVRLPKAEVDKLIRESKDEVEVAEKIVDLYLQNKAGDDGRRLIREEETVS